MKKSKIIGLSLGFTALAAVAVATPFLVTSCSKTDSNEITIPISSEFIQNGTLTEGASIVVSPKYNNIATIYAGKDSKGTNNKTVSFTLSTNVNQIAYGNIFPENIDSSTATVKWVPFSATKGEYTLTEDGKFTLLKELSEEDEGTNNNKKYFQVDLVANITAEAKKEEQTPEQSTETQADETTTPAFNKKLTIKLTIAYGESSSATTNNTPSA